MTRAEAPSSNANQSAFERSTHTRVVLMSVFVQGLFDSVSAKMELDFRQANNGPNTRAATSQSQHIMLETGYDPLCKQFTGEKRAQTKPVKWGTALHASPHLVSEI